MSKLNLKGKIDILFDAERGLFICLRDENSSCTILKVELSPQNAIAALSRCAYIECDYAVTNADKAGKYLELTKVEAEFEESDYSKKKETALVELEKACPDGWELDPYLGSQGSFFSKGERNFARASARRWVEKKEGVSDE